MTAGDLVLTRALELAEKIVEDEIDESGAIELAHQVTEAQIAAGEPGDGLTTLLSGSSPSRLLAYGLMEATDRLLSVGDTVCIWCIQAARAGGERVAAVRRYDEKTLAVHQCRCSNNPLVRAVRGYFLALDRGVSALPAAEAALRKLAEVRDLAEARR